jgi:hypothetical protein
VANLAKSGYVFTRYNRIWGWATWRRAWRVFDRTIPFWPSVRRDPALVALFENEAEYRRYEEVFDLCHAGRIDTWDFQWLLCRMLHGLAIQPTRNLVRNIGFGEDASHPVDPDNLLFATDAPELDLPLAKPRFFLRDHEFDRLWSERIVAHARVPNLTSLPLLLRGRGGGPDS